MIQGLKVAWWFNVLVEPVYDMLQDNQSWQRKVSQTEAVHCDGNSLQWSVQQILPLPLPWWLYSCKFTLDTLHSTTMNWWQRSGTVHTFIRIHSRYLQTFTSAEVITVPPVWNYTYQMILFKTFIYFLWYAHLTFYYKDAATLIYGQNKKEEVNSIAHCFKRVFHLSW